MKIKPDSKAYNQLKECFLRGQQRVNKPFAEYEELGKSLTWYVWDMYWNGYKYQKEDGTIVAMRIFYDKWNFRDADTEIHLEGCHDNHVTTALKHIYENQ